MIPLHTRYSAMAAYTPDENKTAPDGVQKRFLQEYRNHGLTVRAIELFRSIIWSYYRTEGRDFPWRETADPYHIFVSEIMLQQTQVERVRKKYCLFIETFPDFAALASAPLEDILHVWQGLGYNRRAKALQAGAQRVMREFGGALPRDESVLASFPGIGTATAGSIAAFAFDMPSVFIETNIRRVFIHFFFQGQYEVSDREILPLVEATLDRGHPREWYWALMDFGAMLKNHIPNPNIRSSRYRRQPPFKGSDRQLRGKVLRHLLSSGPASKDELFKALKADPTRISRIIGDLIHEGFIVCEVGVVRIV